MKSFKNFVREDEEVQKTLARLPKNIQTMLNGFEFRFYASNTLPGDDGHVGMVVSEPKRIIHISAPWRYGRQFTLLHEIAHIVYAKYIKDTPSEKEWAKISLNTKGRKKDENAEELFCHGFASMYSDYPVPIHDHPEWRKFIHNILKISK